MSLDKLTSIKVPSQCYLRAKDRNILGDVVFYYQLKCLDSHGFIANGTLNSLHKKLPYSQSSIWKKLASLLNSQLIKKHANGYHLVKYDELFTKLGYDLSKHNNRKGKFKINKLPISNLKTIRVLLAYSDIRDNLKYQKINAFRNYRKTNQYSGPKNPSTKDKDQVLRSIVNKHTVQMVSSNDNNKYRCDYSIAIGKSSNTHCNPDVTLSLNGICRILGLNHPSSAKYIIDQMIAFDWITSMHRQLFLGATTLSYKEVKKNFGDSYNIKFGMLVRTLPNLVTCIKK